MSVRRAGSNQTRNAISVTHPTSCHPSLKSGGPTSPLRSRHGFAPHPPSPDRLQKNTGHQLISPQMPRVRDHLKGTGPRSCWPRGQPRATGPGFLGTRGPPQHGTIQGGFSWEGFHADPWAAMPCSCITAPDVGDHTDVGGHT